MATLKQRLHRKNSSGTYDTIHLETSADCITGTLGVTHGGTGKASWTANRLVYASASTTLNQLAFPTTVGSVLRQGTSGAPYWSTPAQLLSDIGAAKKYRYTATIPTSSWSTNSAGGKYKDITVSGMTAAMTPCVGIVQTSDVSASELMLSQFAATIRRIEPMAGKIRVYTYADGTTPSVNIPIQLVGMV